MAEVDFTTAFVDTAGYEELRKHIRESTEFTKELALVLEERAEVEMNYAKLLNKLTVKASKITRTNSGTLSAAWSVLCGQFDAEATIHKNAAETVMKDLQKPLKKMAEQQALSYKLVEAPVNKATKSMNDARAELLKKKKAVYTKSKESQNLYNQVCSQNNAKGKPLSDKDLAKLKTKSQKADEAVAKTEGDYVKQLLLAEKARQDHEIALVGASATVQKLEIDRINQQKTLLTRYSQVIYEMTPKIQSCCDSINRGLTAVQPAADVTAIAKAKGKTPQPTYQFLWDAYEEDPNNGMNINQRKAYVTRQLKMIESEIVKEEKKKDDVALTRKNSTKATKDSKADANMQLMHTNDTLNMLTASKYKLLSSLADVDGQPKPNSGMSQFIRINRDRQGSVLGTLHYPRANAPEPRHARSISNVPSLVIVAAAAAPVKTAPPPGVGVAAAAIVAEKAPAPVASSSRQAPAPPPGGATAADGGATAAAAAAVSAAPPPPPPPPPGAANEDGENATKVIGVCTAIYDFETTDDDQLEIKEGDVINLIEKGDDGWWSGELQGRTGHFPASYVNVEGREGAEDDEYEPIDNDEV